MKHKRSVISIAMATLMLVSLFAVVSSAAGASAAPGSSANVQPSAALVGAPVQSAPAACSVDDAGAFGLFVKGADGALWYQNYGGVWSSLGGYMTSDPAAVSQGAGKITVFVRGGEGALWSKYTTNGGTSWSTWSKIGGQLLAGTGPAAYAWGDARLGWVVTGNDHALWHMWKDSAGTHSWESLGGYLTASPAATSPSSGVIDVYGRGGNGALWQKIFGLGWYSWTSLGGQIAPGTGPAACSPAGSVDIFVIGMNGAVYHRAYTTSWANWGSLGGFSTKSPAATSHGSSDLIDVFVSGGNGDLWYKWHYGAAAWPSWTDLGPGPL